VYFISQIISPFTELEHLFYRPELFDPIGLKGSEAIRAENANHFMPRDHALNNTVESDLFALRSTLYKLITGKAPYEDRSHESVENLFREGVFPDVDGLPKQMSPRNHHFVGTQTLNSCHPVAWRLDAILLNAGFSGFVAINWALAIFHTAVIS
jgi:hypothetical protein